MALGIVYDILNLEKIKENNIAKTKFKLFVCFNLFNSYGMQFLQIPHHSPAVGTAHTTSLEIHWKPCLTQPYP